MTSLLVWCPACKAVKGHVVDGQEMGCSGCGTVRPGPVGVGEPVVNVVELVADVEFCRWCRATKPRVHDCVGDPTPCPDRRPDGSTCGTCPVCLDAQATDLRRHGTPGDLADTP